MSSEASFERQHPVRVLVICSQPLLYNDHCDGQLPVDLLNIQEERNRISIGAKQATSVTEIHFLQEATPQNVREALKENWDVVHVSAHGIKGGTVFFEDGYASSHPLSASEFSDLFCSPLSSKSSSQNLSRCDTDENRKMVIFLSCCYSNELGKALYRRIKNFIPEENFNIVTIKGSMNEDAGLLFAENFYNRLFSEGSVSSAFQHAQRAVEISPIVGDASYVPLATLCDDDDSEDSADSYDTMDLIDSYGSSERQVNNLPWSKRFTLISESPLTIELLDRECLCEEKLLGSVVCHSNIQLQPSNSTLGRSKDVAAIVHLFEHRKTTKVCLSGPVGVGKTECSKALAAWFKERGKVSRVIYATAHESGKLNGTFFSEALGLFEVVRSCTFGPQSLQGLEEQTKSVHQFLESNRALIIIDSFDLLLPENRQRVYNYINSLPSSTLFVFASTEMLSIPEVFNYQIDRLNVQDSRKLFWNVMKASGYLNDKETLQSSDVSAFKSITEELDGIPQAIISVASKTAQRSLQEIHSDLKTDPSYLFVEREEATGKSIGIWNTFLPLYNNLSEPERNLFTYLCAFPGVVTMDLINFVFSNGASVSETMQLLINKSFLKQEGSRLHLYTPLRKFGLRQLDPQTQIFLHKRGIEFHLLYLQNVCLRHLRIQSGLETAKTDKDEPVLTSFSCMMNVIEHLQEMPSTSETFSVHVHRFLNQIDILFDEIILSRNWEQGAKLAQGLIGLAERASLPHLKMRALRFQASIFCHQTDEQCVITENFDNDTTGLSSSPLPSVISSPIRQNILELATQQVSESIHLASAFHEDEELICSLITKAHLELVNGQLESAKETLRGCLMMCQDRRARKEFIITSLSLLARVSKLEGNLSKARRIHMEITELIQLLFSDLQPDVQQLLVATPAGTEQREVDVMWVSQRLRRGHVLAVWNRFEGGHLSRSGGDDSTAKACFKEGLDLSYKVNSPYLTCLMLFSLGSAMLSLHGDRNDQILGEGLQEEDEAAALLQEAFKISLDIRADDLHAEIKSQMSLIDFQFTSSY